MNDNFTDEEKKGFYKAIYSRRDVRSHFTSEPISDNTLTKILHAAHHAPSVGFSQPWNFVLIKDSNTKKIIKESFKIEHKLASELVEDPKEILPALERANKSGVPSIINVHTDPTARALSKFVGSKME